MSTFDADDPRHGTRHLYNKGCRCQPCKSANAFKETKAYESTKGIPKLTMFALLPEPEEWRKRALCAEGDPDSWFPEKVSSLDRRVIGICRTDCPVLALCARQALAGNEMTGVWAGVHLDRLSAAGRRKALSAVIEGKVA